MQKRRREKNSRAARISEMWVNAAKKRKIGSRTIVLVRIWLSLCWWWELAWSEYIWTVAFLFYLFRCIGNRHNGMGWWWVLYVGLTMVFFLLLMSGSTDSALFVSFRLFALMVHELDGVLEPEKRRRNLARVSLSGPPLTFLLLSLQTQSTCSSTRADWIEVAVEYILTKSAYRNFFFFFASLTN